MALTDAIDRRTLLQLGAVMGASLALPAAAQAQSNEKQFTLTQTEAPARLIRGARIITMDPQLGDIDQGDVLIRDGRIVDVGRHLEAPGVEVMDAKGMLMMPGLIDSHWHMWNSVVRNAAPTEQGGTFFKTISALSGRFTPDINAIGVRLSVAEAINAGITTLNDWAHNIRGSRFADAEVQALQESGLRARFWYGYPQDLAAPQRMDFADIERLQKRLGAGGSRVTLGLAIRGPERTAADIWQEEFAFAKAHDLPISTHIAVTRKAQQQRAVRELAQRGLLNAKVQLVHATHVDQDDIAMIAHSGATVSLTPLTEMRVGYGLAPVMALHEAKIPISLGIDTLVLSGNANPFTVMQTTLNLATAMSENELALTPRQVLHMATQGGADEMGLGGEIGSITPGKSADLLLIATDQLGLTPLGDAVAGIVQAASPAHVQTVFANGRLLKHEGRLTGIDSRALMRDVAGAFSALTG